MLSLRHVTKRYGRFTALEDISVNFRSGVYGLLAPNGAGKTTMIKMLTTLLFPTEGKILWNGKDILSLGEEYRGLIGYLPQEFGYYKNQSPLQFLQYMGALQGLDTKKAKAKSEEMLELVGLGDVKKKKMRSFSGGMLQRVGIAQALIHDPKVLILDEPTAGLDPGERVRFRNLLYGLSRNRIVIFSTHIVSDLESIADRIILLRDHHILCNKTPGELKEALRGKIYEMETEDFVPNNEIVPNNEGFAQGNGNGVLPEEFRVLARRQSEKGNTIRAAALKAPENSREVEPTLEDVYLCIYQTEPGKAQKRTETDGCCFFDEDFLDGLVVDEEEAYDYD